MVKGGNWYMQSLQYYNLSHELLTIGNSYEVHFDKGEYALFVYFPFKDFQDRNSVSFELSKASTFYKNRLAYEMYRSVFMGILFFLFVLLCVYGRIC